MINPTNIFAPSLRCETIDSESTPGQVHVTARPEGFIAAILKLLGLSSTSSLSMDASGFRSAIVSFSGKTQTYCPLNNIAACVYTMSKPVGLLVLGMILLLYSVGMLMSGEMYVLIGIIVLLIALFCLYKFIADRRVVIGIVSNGSTAESLKLKATAGEIRQLEVAAQIMESLLHAAGTPVHSPAPATQRASPPTVPPYGDGHVQPDGGPLICPHCQSQLQIPATLRGRRARCPSCKEVIQVP